LLAAGCWGSFSGSSGDFSTRACSTSISVVLRGPKKFVVLTSPCGCGLSTTFSPVRLRSFAFASSARETPQLTVAGPVGWSLAALCEGLHIAVHTSTSEARIFIL
jgi:hypothetical protein